MGYAGAEIEIRCGIDTGTNAFKRRRHGGKYGGDAEEIRRRRSGGTEEIRSEYGDDNRTVRRKRRGDTKET